MTIHRVLIHLDEGSTFRGKLVMDNIANLLDDFEEDKVQIELVVNGAGVKLFLRQSSPISSEVEFLIRRGVQIAICRNSIQFHQLDETSFLDKVTFVNSGVGELVRKQTKDWSYIRP